MQKIMEEAEKALNKNGIELEVFSNLELVSRGGHRKLELWVNKRSLVPEKEAFAKANTDFKVATDGVELIFAGVFWKESI